MEKRIIEGVVSFSKTLQEGLPPKSKTAKKRENTFASAIDQLSPAIKEAYRRMENVNFLVKYMPDLDTAMVLQYDAALARMVAEYAMETVNRIEAKQAEEEASKNRRRNGNR